MGIVMAETWWKRTPTIMIMVVLMDAYRLVRERSARSSFVVGVLVLGTCLIDR